MTARPTIPPVAIDDDGGHKYIVAAVSDSDGVFQTVIRADKTRKFHAELLTDLRDEIQPLGLTAKCLGGGRIRVDSAAKTITLSGSSLAFGSEPNRQQTAAVIESELPDFQITVRH